MAWGTSTISHQFYFVVWWYLTCDFQRNIQEYFDYICLWPNAPTLELKTPHRTRLNYTENKFNLAFNILISKSINIYNYKLLLPKFVSTITC